MFWAFFEADSLPPHHSAAKPRVRLNFLFLCDSQSPVHEKPYLALMGHLPVKTMMLTMTAMMPEDHVKDLSTTHTSSTWPEISQGSQNRNGNTSSSISVIKNYLVFLQTLVVHCLKG